MTCELGHEGCQGHVSDEQLVKGVNANLADPGWTTVVVGPGPESPAYAYTVGLHLQGLPEIIMMLDLPAQVLQFVANGFAFEWVNNKKETLGLQPGALKMASGPNGDVFSLLVQPDYAMDNFMGEVWRYYTLTNRPLDNIRIAQVYLPDDHLRLPTDPAYDQGGFPQPMLPPLVLN